VAHLGGVHEGAPKRGIRQAWPEARVRPRGGGDALTEDEGARESGITEIGTEEGGTVNHAIREALFKQLTAS